MSDELRQHNTKHLTTGNSRPNSPGARVIELARLRFGVEAMISQKTWKFAIEPQVRLEEVIRFATDDLVLRLEQEVFGREASVTISYPLGLWAYIKCALGLKHERRVHKVNGSVLFPDINVPGHRACVIVREAHRDESVY